MVSYKSGKVSYAERVLGAFSYLQREHRKHDIHVASLRAQIKRHAQAKNDTLGPHWTHWVSKAITKLESEGILEHTVPGTVALTSDGKRAIADARRSFQIASPQKDQDLVWKQVTTTASRGTKRPRKSSAFNRDVIDSDSEDDTASRAGNKTPRKRPRASAVRSSPNKSMSKLTKSELQTELASVKRAYAEAIRRPSSPLTDISDDDAAELKEKLQERDQAIEKMRRELSLMRNEISRDENQAAGRSDTPGPILDFDQMSSPIGVPAMMSRLRGNGVTRTHSGSYIPVLSKQPTPAPSSSDRDDDYGQAGDLGVENPDMAIDDNTRARPTSLGDVQELSTLKHKIQDLQKRLATDLVVISSKETEISNLEKDISDRARTHESIISDRDGTIASLREKVSELKTEANDLRESRRLAEETAASLTLELQSVEVLITELRAEADVSKTTVGVLEMSNADLLRDQETMKLDLEQAEAARIETEQAAEDVRNHAKAVSDELFSVKMLQAEQNAEIEDLVNSLSRTSNETQALRENSRMFEASIAGYKAEIRMKDEMCQNLEIRVKQNDSRTAQLFADLQTAERSVEDMRTRLAEANKRVADAELMNKRLKTELSLKDDTVRQYQDDLATVQGRFAEAQMEVVESSTRHTNDSMALASTISDLRDALATANIDVERLTLRLHALEDKRLSIQCDFEKKRADLLDTVNILEMERKEKMGLKADMMAYISKTQELEEELGYVKMSKVTDEATISSLRGLFMKLRESQLQMMGEFEQEVISAQSSPMPLRV